MLENIIKLDYSDFYKFTTSFGLLLIISSFLIYILFLGYAYNTAETFLKDYTPEKLASEGYSNTTIQQFDNLYASKLKNILSTGYMIPILSLVLCICGCVLFIYGFFNWKEKQQKIFDRLDISRFEQVEIEKERSKNKLAFEKEIMPFIHKKLKGKEIKKNGI